MAHVTGGPQKRTRKHEALVKAYGEYLEGQGWRAITNRHPRDLVARRDGSREVLCEMKTVKANAEHAVREAIGQLFTYRHLLYLPNHRPLLVAVFSGPVGEGFVDLLTELGIASVWREGGAWHGSTTAIERGLGERTQPSAAHR